MFGKNVRRRSVIFEFRTKSLAQVQNLQSQKHYHVPNDALLPGKAYVAEKE